jgi:transposase-like protein
VTCPHCQSDKVGHQIGGWWIRYECMDCNEVWTEVFSGGYDRQADNRQKRR